MKNIYELFEDFFQKKLTPEELEAKLRERQGGEMSVQKVARQYLFLKKSTDEDHTGRWVEAGIFSGNNLREALEKYFQNHPPVDLKVAEITQKPHIYPISEINKFLGK